MIEDIDRNIFEDSRGTFPPGYNYCRMLHRALRQGVLSASALARFLCMRVYNFFKAPESQSNAVRGVAKSSLSSRIEGNEISWKFSSFRHSWHDSVDVLSLLVLLKCLRMNCNWAWIYRSPLLLRAPYQSMLDFLCFRWQPSIRCKRDNRFLFAVRSCSSITIHEIRSTKHST